MPLQHIRGFTLMHYIYSGWHWHYLSGRGGNSVVRMRT